MQTTSTWATSTTCPACPRCPRWRRWSRGSPTPGPGATCWVCPRPGPCDKAATGPEPRESLLVTISSSSPTPASRHLGTCCGETRTLYLDRYLVSSHQARCRHIKPAGEIIRNKSSSNPFALYYFLFFLVPINIYDVFHVACCIKKYLNHHDQHELIAT